MEQPALPAQVRRARLVGGSCWGEGAGAGAHLALWIGGFRRAVEVLRLVNRLAVWASHLVAHRLGAGTETRDEDLAQGLARRAHQPDARAAWRLRHRRLSTRTQSG
eukprot:scaffold58946_cov63-Phaeocystis_antarctica.AAC.14